MPQYAVVRYVGPIAKIVQTTLGPGARPVKHDLQTALNLAVHTPDPQDVLDLNLIATTASGGKAAFETLYSRYERRVYNYVRTFVRQPSVSEEVVIDTMMAVWNGAKGFNRSSRVSTWILGIARHKALDAVRKVGRSGAEVTLDDASELPDEATGPADAVDQVFRSKLVRRAVAELSIDHQEILRLAFFEELPYEEIASLLSIPDNTVKTRVFYAKQQLRRLLEGRELETAE